MATCLRNPMQSPPGTLYYTLQDQLASTVGTLDANCSFVAGTDCPIISIAAARPRS